MYLIGKSNIHNEKKLFAETLLFSRLCSTLSLPIRFIRVGGYKLLNSWLTYSKTTTNTPLLQLILLTLQKLPLTVDHLKQVLHHTTAHKTHTLAPAVF